MQRKLNKSFLAFLLGLMALFVLVGFTAPALAGDLEPTEPPGPTMKTLDEVEPRIPISSMPYTISEPGSYYLTSDLTSTDNGILVEADNISIDLMGYGVIGPGEGVGIFMDGCSNVEIRNGTVPGFSSGILERDVGGKGHRIIDVRAVSNGDNGIRLLGYHHLVKDCTVVENGVGIYAGTGCMVTGNIASRNQGTGIYVGSDCTVTGNTVRGNHQHGIRSSSRSTVTSNTVCNNDQHGIRVNGGCMVTGNIASRNRLTGIFAGRGSTVAGNTVYRNNIDNGEMDAGIRVISKCLVKGNTVTFNESKNIYVRDSGNAIEENLMTDSLYCIVFRRGVGGNFIANNRAARNNASFSRGTYSNMDGGRNVAF